MSFDEHVEHKKGKHEKVELMKRGKKRRSKKE